MAGPTAPENVTLIELNATTIEVSWATPSSPNGILLHFIIYFALDDGVFDEDSVRVNAIEGTDNYTFVLSNLMEFSRYRIQLTAATRIGESVRTRAMFVETDPDSASPPSFVSGSTINSTAVELTWGYPDMPRGNISGYTIFHNANATRDGNFTTFNFTLSVVNDQNNQSFVFGGLRPFMCYQFQVAAYSFSDDFQLHLGAYNGEAAVVCTAEAGK